MCPMTNEPKVILNYDNVPGLAVRWPGTVIRPNPGRSHAVDHMADTVYMMRRPLLSRDDMLRLAKKAAPLASRVIIEDCHADPSHDTRISEHRIWRCA